MNQNNDKMHPEDMRNMIIFFALALALYFGYNTFIAKPQKEALEKVRVAQEKVEIEQAVNPTLAIQPREQMIAQNKRFQIKNAQVTGSLSLKGGRLDDISFNEHFETNQKKKKVSSLSPLSTEYPRYVDYGWVSMDKGTKLPNEKTIWRVAGNTKLTQSTPVTIFWNNGRGLRFERTYALDDQFMFTVTQKITNNSGKQITLYPYALISQTGLPKDLQGAWIMHEGPMGYIGDELVELKYKTLKKEKQATYQSASGWTGITDKYWLTSLIPAQGVNIKYRYNFINGPLVPKDQADRSRYQVDMMGEAIQIAVGNTAEATTHLFAGVKKVDLLSKYSEEYNIPNFDLAVDFGLFWIMTKPFYHILHFLYGLVGNFGVAILLLTLLIRTAVFPLTNLSYVSFAKMKKVSPQMTELREKYKDDKPALQKAIMELYQKEGVNPMSGCFPIILQIPIFFSLYKVLFINIDMRHAPFYGWIQDLSAKDPTSIFNLFGLFPYSVPEFLVIGVWPCAMLLVMLVQRKLNPPPQDPLQRDMMLYFPFIMTFILSKFAAGLVMYWAFSALLSVLQQMVIMRRLNVPIHLFGETEEEKELDDAIDKGPAVHPIAEMVEDEIEDALFGTDNPVNPEKPISKPKPKKSKAKSKKTNKKKK